MSTPLFAFTYVRYSVKNNSMYDIKFDELGPMKIVRLHSAKAGLDAAVVIDNIALGPAIGGVRVSPAVGPLEIARLARTMTFKNSIAGLPHGGGKAGITADPAAPGKEKLFRAFAKMIKTLNEFIPGPDMGSDEECMAWIYDETKRAIGRPERQGGLPLDKLGATGFGLAECAEVACPYAGINLDGARVALHGFGNVGGAAARSLLKRGAIIVAVVDRRGGVFDAGGLDLDKLFALRSQRGSVADYKTVYAKGVALEPEEVISVECDILVPAATPDVINAANQASIKAKMVLQGANIPVTGKAEELLARRGVLSVPDFIANAGGVIMAAAEYAGETCRDAFRDIAVKIKKNTLAVLEKAKNENKLPRAAAVELARQRIAEAMEKSEF